MTTQVLRKKERRTIVDLYKHHAGNKKQLSAALKITRQTLHRWLREDPDLARALHKADAELFEMRLKKARAG